MDIQVPHHVTGLLLLIDRLCQSNRPLGRATLQPYAALKLPEVARDYDALVGYLLENQLAQGDAESFQLTPAGRQIVGETAAEQSLHAWFYGEYYQAVRCSSAHALFCERVYGQDLSQHGVADMAQIGLLLDELDLQPGMTLLDFGCGDGQISEYISDITGTLVSGVDIAPRAIELATERTQAKRDRLRFYCADVERQRGSFPAGPFDRICAIDSIFFARDQRAVLEILLGHLVPSGRIGLFFLCPPEVSSEETALAQALRALGASYRVHDLSAQNKEHWLRKKAVLEELAPMFRAEGSDFLLKNRLAECEGLEQFHRYLYLASFCRCRVGR